jgi:hypothetical protein
LFKPRKQKFTTNATAGSTMIFISLKNQNHMAKGAVKLFYDSFSATGNELGPGHSVYGIIIIHDKQHSDKISYAIDYHNQLLSAIAITRCYDYLCSAHVTNTYMYFVMCSR